MCRLYLKYYNVKIIKNKMMIRGLYFKKIVYSKYYLQYEKQKRPIFLLSTYSIHLYTNKYFIELLLKSFQHKHNMY